MGGTWALGKLLAQKHQTELLSHTLSRVDEAEFDELARTSLIEQAQLEATDTIGFYDYLKAYR